MGNVTALKGKRVEDALMNRRHSCRCLESFWHGNVLAQVNRHTSADGVVYRSFTIDRLFETTEGFRKGELLLTAQGIRNCKKALRSVKKWRRNEIRERRRKMLRQLFGI